MKSIEVLKSRLTNDNTLYVQQEQGYFEEMGFEWKNPATEIEIQNFEEKYNLVLPNEFKSFLKISNGALLFKDRQYGQWGCHLLGLDELIEMTEEVATWGYKLEPGWLVFSTWLGDCDILAFDLNKSAAGDENYIVEIEQGSKADEWENMRGGFANWLDRLIVAQGTKYWRWA